MAAILFRASWVNTKYALIYCGVKKWAGLILVHCGILKDNGYVWIFQLLKLGGIAILSVGLRESNLLRTIPLLPHFLSVQWSVSWPGPRDVDWRSGPPSFRPSCSQQMSTETYHRRFNWLCLLHCDSYHQGCGIFPGPRKWIWPLANLSI